MSAVIIILAGFVVLVIAEAVRKSRVRTAEHILAKRLMAEERERKRGWVNRG